MISPLDSQLDIGFHSFPLKEKAVPNTGDHRLWPSLPQLVWDPDSFSFSLGFTMYYYSHFGRLYNLLENATDLIKYCEDRQSVSWFLISGNV